MVKRRSILCALSERTTCLLIPRLCRILGIIDVVDAGILHCVCLCNKCAGILRIGLKGRLSNVCRSRVDGVIPCKDFWWNGNCGGSCAALAAAAHFYSPATFLAVFTDLTIRSKSFLLIRTLPPCAKPAPWPPPYCWSPGDGPLPPALPNCCCC